MLLNLCYVLRSKVRSSYCYYVFIFTAILKQQQAVYRVQVEVATRREGLHLWPSVSILCRTLCVILIGGTPFGGVVHSELSTNQNYYTLVNKVV